MNNLKNFVLSLLEKTVVLTVQLRYGFILLNVCSFSFGFRQECSVHKLMSGNLFLNLKANQRTLK